MKEKIKEGYYILGEMVYDGTKWAANHLITLNGLSWLVAGATMIILGVKALGGG